MYNANDGNVVYGGAADAVKQVLGSTPATSLERDVLDHKVVVIGCSKIDNTAINFVLTYPQICVGLVPVPSAMGTRGVSKEDSILTALDSSSKKKRP